MTENSALSRFRRKHPLIKLMRKIRKQHKLALTDVEARMGIPFQTLKQIEEGRRPLPGLVEQSGASLGRWMQNWMSVIGVTNEERQEVEGLLMDLILDRFEGSLT